MFGDKLRELIEKKYDTQAKFADVCNIPRSTLSDVINNKKIPRENNLNLYIEKLQPLSKEDEAELIKEWTLGKTNGKYKKEIEELEKKNKNMVEVLKSVKKEKDLLEEISNLKQYEAFYNLFFEDLTIDETKIVLHSLIKELKIIYIDNGKMELYKTKFKSIEKMIDNLEKEEFGILKK